MYQLIIISKCYRAQGVPLVTLSHVSSTSKRERDVDVDIGVRFGIAVRVELEVGRGV